MDLATPLEGGCSCGRNHYLIYTSTPASQHLHVTVDDRVSNGRVNPRVVRMHIQRLISAGPTLSLRVPLSCLHSTTYALYPDETHSAIRRVFTPYYAPHTKRHFCGFCGTSLSRWNDESPNEAEWIYVNLNSLRSESLERLQDAGLLAASEEANGENSQQNTAIIQQDGRQGREIQGVPWFEEMVEGSELGRIKRRRGGKTSADGRTKYEWEIVEIGGEEGEATAAGTVKRKLGAMGAGDDDVEMKSG